MKLNPEKDLEIDVSDLTSEFKSLSLLLYRYSQSKADAEREYDRAKRTLEEIRAHVYRQIKADSSVKHTEASLEAAITVHDDVRKVGDLLTDTKHTLSTWVGAVESVKAKKDMLIQLGSDRRKEV